MCCGELLVPPRSCVVRKKLSLPPLVTVGIALLAVVGGSGPSYAKDNEVIDYEPKVVLSKYEVEAFSYDKRSRPGFPARTKMRLIRQNRRINCPAEGLRFPCFLSSPLDGRYPDLLRFQYG